MNMRILLTAVVIAPLLGWAGQARALGRGELLLHADAGAGFALANQHYEQMQHTSGALGAGASLKLRPGLRATLDASWFHFWRSGPSVAAPEDHITWDPSNVSLALLGVELEQPAPTQAGPFTALGAGVARVAIGDTHVTSINGPPFTNPGDRVTKPAFAIRAGVRTPPGGRAGPSLQVQLGLVFIAVPGNRATIVPLTIGAVF